ncbi:MULTISPECIES: CGNR zinc finger domain-containing protein [unclassified Nonomuraea]|uniref:CGNR zinc finger domain-containing protein n=1 Tax=unclassified Nonomuraea TaxID=2593643 RepID=UPI00340E67EA
MKVHSTKAMAARAVDLCAVLLYAGPPGGPSAGPSVGPSVRAGAGPSVESVAAVLRAHGETVVPVHGARPGPAGEDLRAGGDGPAGGELPVGGDVPAQPASPGAAMSPYLGEDDVAAMREAAERLVEVLAAPGPDEAAGLLNRLLAGTARPPRLTSHGGTSPWHVHVDSRDDAPWAEWFLASSAMALAVLLAEHQRVPGGLCASPGCRRPYLDLGGGSPRRYCSARCATRERVAAHRSRA